MAKRGADEFGNKAKRGVDEFGNKQHFDALMFRYFAAKSHAFCSWRGGGSADLLRVG